MRPAKIVAIVIGALLILIGIGLLVPGSLLLWLNNAGRDGQGFFMTSTRSLGSEGYALTTPEVDLGMGPGDWVPAGGVGTLRIRATSPGGDPVFIGIGPADEVSAYLDGVAYDEVTNLGWFSSSVEYRTYAGGAPPAPPGQQTFWIVKQEGLDTQTLEWDLQGGNWTAVLMNADASAPVDARVSLGAHFDILLPIGIGMTVAGVVLLAVGIVLIVLGARRPRKPSQPEYAGASPGAQPYGAYPQAPGPYSPPPGQYPSSGQYAPPPGQYPPGAQPSYQPVPAQQPLYQQPPEAYTPAPGPQPATQSYPQQVPQPVPPPAGAEPVESSLEKTEEPPAGTTGAS
jgi:hypothetical protein